MFSTSAATASSSSSDWAFFDPRLGFLPDLAVVAAASSSSQDTPMADAPPDLSAVCAELVLVVEVLFDRTVAERVGQRFAVLSAEALDPDHPRLNETYRDYLLGDGARLLQRLVRLGACDRIDVRLRRERIEDVGDASQHCLTGFSFALQDAVQVLACAAGGAAASAVGARSALTRQVLDGFVRRTIGRDPELSSTLASYAPHYLAALERRLRLPAASDYPFDQFFDARSLSPELVQEAAVLLRARVTPVQVALRMAESGLTGLRQRLREAGLEGIDLGRMEARQCQDFEAARVELERALGPVRAVSLVDEEVAPASAPVLDSACRTGVAVDASLLAVDVLWNLEQAGVLRVEAPLRLMGWRGDDGARVDLMRLRGGLCWVRRHGDDRQVSSVCMKDLRAIDLTADAMRAVRLPGGRRERALTPSQRESVARPALARATDAELGTVDPRWLVSDELARGWWRRTIPAQRDAWWSRHPPVTLPLDALGPLMTAADEAGDWERLHALVPFARPRALAAWRACDGAGAMSQALRTGDVDRLDCWVTVLRRAAPCMTRSQCFHDLAGKDAHGRAALCEAMRHGAPVPLRAYLRTVFNLWRGGRLEAGALERLLSGQLRGDSPTPVGEALASGRPDLLEAFLDALWEALRDGPSDRKRLGVLLGRAMGDDGTLVPDGLTQAMAANRADAVAVWMRHLLRATREGVIDGGTLIDLMTAACSNGQTAYTRAMEEGSAEAITHFLDALVEARRDHLIGQHLVIDALLGEDDSPHPPSLAAGRGHSRCLALHLAAETLLLPARALNEYTDLCLRWTRRGAHTAIDAAMESGCAESVRLLMNAALESRVFLSRDLLARTYVGRPGQRPVLLAAMDLGRGEAVSAWLEGVAAAAAAKQLRRSELRHLLRAEFTGWETALHRATHAMPAEMISRLADGIVDMARATGLRSRDLVSLLGYRRHGRVVSPLAVALNGHRCIAMRMLAATILRARAEGLLNRDHVEHLLSMRIGSGHVGLSAHRPAQSAESELGVAEYAGIVVKATQAGAITAAKGRVWLYGQASEGGRERWIADVLDRVVRAAESRGQIKPIDANTLLGRSSR
ncbi:hypothetical protein [Roseateles aquatilis]|nr:hypothetical protein [Roseateles aquatilis]